MPNPDPGKRYPRPSGADAHHRFNDPLMPLTPLTPLPASRRLPLNPHGKLPNPFASFRVFEVNNLRFNPYAFCTAGDFIDHPSPAIFPPLFTVNLQLRPSSNSKRFARSYIRVVVRSYYGNTAFLITREIRYDRRRFETLWNSRTPRI